MEKDCLVKKFKASANNINLPVYGTLDIKMIVDPAWNNNAETINNSANSVIALGGNDGAFEILEGDSVGITFSNGSKKVDSTLGKNIGFSNITENEEFTLRVKSKYILTNIDSVHLAVKDINIFKYVPLLIRFCVPTSIYTIGDVSNLPENQFTGLYIRSENVTGDYSEVVKRLQTDNNTSWSQVILFSGITGDLSITPAHVQYINTSSAGMTWTLNNRAGQSYEVLTLGSDNIGVFMSATDVDNYFIDNAKCHWTSGRGNTKIGIRTIKNATSYTPSVEAQSAIATLYNMGVTSIKVLNTEMDAYRNI